tara:strand:+ start:342 stop:1073 length:732 start_codon:yes stop_codon:yes gene_type:complete
MRKKKLLIFVLSYKASFRVLDVYKEIPLNKLKQFNLEILLSDDCSNDDTIKFMKNIQKFNKNVKINVNKYNLKYGGHIKKCLNYAVKNKFDYSVMIHGDGQYSPKYIPKLISKLLKGKAKFVCGSRMNKSALTQMPFYKIIGNLILTKIFNLLFKQNFSDAHSGLWAYNIKYVKNVKFNSFTNGFNFDQEFRIKNILLNNLIEEIPIKTRYGDERSQTHFIYSIKFFVLCIQIFLIKNKTLNH